MSEFRGRCFRCYRPASSCMCAHINPIPTRTKFVILMHVKEFRKTKNGTGHLTHLSLPNSEIHVAIDFSRHERVNALIDDPANACYVLYPGKESINLNETSIEKPGKNNVVFIIDSTWPCSKKILRLSTNLAKLPRISFDHSRLSQFKIKQQPKHYCLSTIESTQCVLELLNAHKNEAIETRQLENFLEPFQAMVQYQIGCIEKCHDTAYGDKNAVRFKARRGER